MNTLISDEYRALNAELHREREDYGRRGHAWAEHVRDLCRQVGSKDVLDYGCGKATLAAHCTDLDVHCYDPAIPQHSADPAPADVVICVDVIEHIEPENVNNVIAHIASKTRRIALLSVACRPAAKVLADGRNAHLSVHDPLWWSRVICQQFDLVKTGTHGNTFSMVVKPKAKPHTYVKEKPQPSVIPMPWVTVAAIQEQCKHAGSWPASALNTSGFEGAMTAGDYATAAVFLRRAIAIDPDDEHAQNNLATCMKHLGRDEEALRIYLRLLERRPDFLMANNNISRLYLRKGDFKRGWHHYRWRLTPARAIDEMPRDALQGRLLGEIPDPTPEEVRRDGIFLAPEQGLGDELFFLRWVPELVRKARPAKVWYCPTTKLRPLVERAGWPLEVAPYDAFWTPSDTPVLPLGCLPRWLEHERLEDVPPPLPLRARKWWWRWLLQPPVARAARPGMRWIGVTWRAGVEGSRHRGGLFKEIPPAVLGEALNHVQDAEFVVMQRGMRKEEYDAFREAVGPSRVHLVKTEAWAPEVELEYLLRLLADLDDYIGVSNTNIYLRMAMGLKGRAILGHPAEWRWLDGPADSPFFPGFRTYREELRRGWGPAMAALTSDLLLRP